MIKRIAHALIRQAEARVGVQFDYAHRIADTNIGLLSRYNRIFGFLDPNKHAPKDAYHVARLRGAVSADCGTCVEAEVKLAQTAGLRADLIDQALVGDYEGWPASLSATARLADAVVGRCEDNVEAREAIISAYGEAALIEICFAMNGAALLPGLKRGMGYATACDIDVMRRLANAAS